MTPRTGLAAHGKMLADGELFTQGGADLPAVTESDILGPSEAFRHAMDYFSHTKSARLMLERLAATTPAHWRACTAAPGVAMERNCLMLLLMRCVHDPGISTGLVPLTERPDAGSAA